MEQQQEWIDIPGYPGYKINREAQVLGKQGKPLTQCFARDADGAPTYRLVAVRVNGKSKTAFVHRLVALTFVANPNPSSACFVNHKNYDKQDNRAENLEWVTPSENGKHSCLRSHVLDKLKVARAVSAANRTR